MRLLVLLLLPRLAFALCDSDLLAASCQLQMTLVASPEMLYGVASAALEPIGECSTRALLTRNAAQIDRLLNEHEPREQSICGSQDELTFTLTQILPANRSGIIFILVANTSELAVKALKLIERYDLLVIPANLAIAILPIEEEADDFAQTLSLRQRIRPSSHVTTAVVNSSGIFCYAPLEEDNTQRDNVDILVQEVYPFTNASASAEVDVVTAQEPYLRRSDVDGMLPEVFLAYIARQRNMSVTYWTFENETVAARGEAQFAKLVNNFRVTMATGLFLTTNCYALNYRLTRVPVDVDFVAIIDNQYVPSGLQTSPGAVLKILHPTEWFLIVAAVIAVALLYVLLRSSSTAFSRSYASGSDTPLPTMAIMWRRKRAANLRMEMPDVSRVVIELLGPMLGGHVELIAKGAAQAALATAWLFFGFFIASTFSAKLFATLASSTAQQPFDDSLALVDSDYKLIIDNTMKTYLQDRVSAHSGSAEQLERLQGRLENADFRSDTNATELANGLLRVKSAAMMTFPTFETLFNDCHYRKRLQFGIRIRRPPGYYYASVMASRLNPLAVELERRVQLFSEAGLFAHELNIRWHRCRLTLSGDLTGANTRGRICPAARLLSCYEADYSSVRTAPLSFGQLQTGFWLILYGYTFAVVSFLAEALFLLCGGVKQQKSPKADEEKPPARTHSETAEPDRRIDELTLSEIRALLGEKSGSLAVNVADIKTCERLCAKLEKLAGQIKENKRDKAAKQVGDSSDSSDS